MGFDFEFCTVMNNNNININYVYNANVRNEIQGHLGRRNNALISPP